MPSESPTPRVLFGVALTSGSLLMTELSLTRIFSVTMYYHFAFMAISIALFGLSASGVYVFLFRDRLAARSTVRLLTSHALAFAALTLIALAALVRVRVGFQLDACQHRVDLHHVLAGGAAVLRRRRRRVHRDRPPQRQRQPGVRGRPARCRGGVSPVAACAQPAGCARRHRRGGAHGGRGGGAVRRTGTSRAPGDDRGSTRCGGGDCRAIAARAIYA